jgi:hypothetical protein
VGRSAPPFWAGWRLFFPSSKIPCQNPPRGKTGGWRGAGRAVPGTLTSFVMVLHGQAGAGAGSALLVGAIWRLFSPSGKEVRGWLLLCPTLPSAATPGNAAPTRCDRNAHTASQVLSWICYRRRCRWGWAPTHRQHDRLLAIVPGDLQNLVQHAVQNPVHQAFSARQGAASSNFVGGGACLVPWQQALVLTVRR